MKNSYIIKLAGMFAMVSFLFFPVAGCGPMNITGIDLIKMNDVDNSVKIFAVLGMLCAVGILLFQDKLQVFFSAIAGIGSLVIAFLIVKSKMHSGMSDGIEIKSGAYLSLLGFIVSAIVSRIENEILVDQRLNGSSSNLNKGKQANFCPSCGVKIEDNETIYCDNCGMKI